MKRVAFVISKQHLIPHGGIGQFAKSFYELCGRLGWDMDIIVDVHPSSNSLVEYFDEKEVQFFGPKRGDLAYTHHRKTFSFKDGFCFERVVNFREAMMSALEEHVYDMVVINTPEAAPAVYGLDLHPYIPVVFYTHNENCVFMNTKQSTVFNESFNEMTTRFMQWDGMIVGTHSNPNVDAIKQHYSTSDARCLPIPVAERDLLEYKEKEVDDGILFTGRWEDRKKPEIYIKAIVATGAKALVLTGPNSVKKWEQKFEENGITNYEIKAGIIGQEKVEFIRQAEMAFMPASQESYGLGAFEALHVCPVVAITEYDWHKNFHVFGVSSIIPVSKKTAIEDVKEVYENIDMYRCPKKDQARNTAVVNHDTITTGQWKNVVSSFEGKRTPGRNKVVDIVKAGYYISIPDLYKKMGRLGKISIDDVQSVLCKLDQIYVHNINGKTYLSEFPEIDEMVKDDEVVGLDAFF